MSGTAVILRSLRAGLAVYLCSAVAIVIVDALDYLRFSVAFASVAAFLVLPVLAATFVIRRLGAADRHRPDYSAIAAMEREVWGEAFKHDGAPEPAKPKPCKQTRAQMFEDDRRAMRALAAASRGKKALERERCYCDWCRGRTGIHGDEATALYRAHAAAAQARHNDQMCAQHDEYPSNLRWERPS